MFNVSKIPIDFQADTSILDLLFCLNNNATEARSLTTATVSQLFFLILNKLCIKSTHWSFFTSFWPCKFWLFYQNNKQFADCSSTEILYFLPLLRHRSVSQQSKPQVRISLYADDTALWIKSTTAIVAFQYLNTALARLWVWFRMWKIKSNPTKDQVTLPNIKSSYLDVRLCFCFHPFSHSNLSRNHLSGHLLLTSKIEAVKQCASTIGRWWAWITFTSPRRCEIWVESPQWIRVSIHSKTDMSIGLSTFSAHHLVQKNVQTTTRNPIVTNSGNFPPEQEDILEGTLSLDKRTLIFSAKHHPLLHFYVFS